LVDKPRISELIFGSGQYVLRNSRELIKCSLPIIFPLIVAKAIFEIGGFYSKWAGIAGFFETYLMICFALSWHRFCLLGPAKNNIVSPFALKKGDGYFIFTFVWILVIFIGQFLITVLSVQYTGHLHDMFVAWSIFLVALAFTFSAFLAVIQLMLLLPARATGAPIQVKEAFSRGLPGQMFVAFVFWGLVDTAVTKAWKWLCGIFVSDKPITLTDTIITYLIIDVPHLLLLLIWSAINVTIICRVYKWSVENRSLSRDNNGSTTITDRIDREGTALMANNPNQSRLGQYFGGFIILAAGFYIMHAATTGPAARLFQKADRGDAEAQLEMGYKYEHGIGFNQNYPEALNWYQKAADQGNAEAEFYVGHMYEKGLGVGQDNSEMVKWYKKAADHGLAEAEHNLGNAYLDGNGVPIDYDQALKWQMKAADQGQALAEFSVGLMYLKGQGVTQDKSEGAKWIEKAAEQDDEEAENNLGTMYLQGEGVSQEYPEALKWFQKSADHGDPKAQNNLAVMFYQGLGTKVDKEQAYFWWLLAAKGGEKDAASNCEQLVKLLTPVQVSETKAKADAWKAKSP
jgi:TPR repeat protein